MSGQFHAPAALLFGTEHLLDRRVGESQAGPKEKRKVPASARNRTPVIRPVVGHLTVLLRFMSLITYETLTLWVALGGLVVSVLATGPKVAGSNPAEDDGF
jgi:hypothetical protein